MKKLRHSLDRPSRSDFVQSGFFQFFILLILFRWNFFWKSTLRSFGHRLPGFSEELLMSGVPLLETLRSSLYNWLETILLSGA